LKSNQLRDKVLPNNSQVKAKKTRTKKPNVMPISTKKFVEKFVEKFLGTIRFGNDQFAPIIGYGDLVQGNVIINRVYYVKGLNHNLFSVGQFCDADLEVSFRKYTCFVRDLQGNDLLVGNHGSNLYTISLQESTSSTPLCLMAKATPTQAWLWHRRLSHLNFDYINLLQRRISKKKLIQVKRCSKFQRKQNLLHMDLCGPIRVASINGKKYILDQLCSSCELSKAKRSSFKSKAVPCSKGRLNLLHMDVCGPMRVASINGKKYILVIVDDYSRYTWTLFLRSKDETPEVLKDFLTMIQRNLQASVITIRTDRGTEFLNKTLNAFFKEEGIQHQTLTARTPEQNGVVERQNHTLETLNQTPSFFGCICYITRDGENLDKMKEKWDQCILVGYSTQSKGYRVYNKRTRMMVKSIHICFDEIKEVSETSVANNTSGLSTSAPSTHTNVHAEENNNDQENEGEHVQDDEFTNPFCAPTQEVAESSSHNIGNSNVPTFNQPQVSDYRWTKDTSSWKSIKASAD
nr:hypothetical protein [Tanacetum cinerariifolium]